MDYSKLTGVRPDQCVLFAPTSPKTVCSPFRSGRQEFAEMTEARRSPLCASGPRRGEPSCRSSSESIPDTRPFSSPRARAGLVPLRCPIVPFESKRDASRWMSSFSHLMFAEAQGTGKQQEGFEQSWIAGSATRRFASREGCLGERRRAHLGERG
jgi:hypothetical protein